MRRERGEPREDLEDLRGQSAGGTRLGGGRLRLRGGGFWSC